MKNTIISILCIFVLSINCLAQESDFKTLEKLYNAIQVNTDKEKDKQLIQQYENMFYSLFEHIRRENKVKYLKQFLNLKFELRKDCKNARAVSTIVLLDNNSLLQFSKQELHLLLYFCESDEYAKRIFTFEDKIDSVINQNKKTYLKDLLLNTPRQEINYEQGQIFRRENQKIIDNEIINEGKGSLWAYMALLRVIPKDKKPMAYSRGRIALYGTEGKDNAEHILKFFKSQGIRITLEDINLYEWPRLNLSDIKSLFENGVVASTTEPCALLEKLLLDYNSYSVNENEISILKYLVDQGAFVSSKFYYETRNSGKDWNIRGCYKNSSVYLYPKNEKDRRVAEDIDYIFDILYEKAKKQ